MRKSCCKEGLPWAFPSLVSDLNFAMSQIDGFIVNLMLIILNIYIHYMIAIDTRS